MTMEPRSIQQLAEYVAVMIPMELRHTVYVEDRGRFVSIIMYNHGRKCQEAKIDLEDKEYTGKQRTTEQLRVLVEDVIEGYSKIYFSSPKHQRNRELYKLINHYQVPYDWKCGYYYEGDRISSLRIELKENGVKIDAHYGIRIQGENNHAHYINLQETDIPHKTLTHSIERYRRTDRNIRDYTAMLQATSKLFSQQLLLAHN